MEPDWHKRLEDISDELKATVTMTEDGPMLIDALLDLIKVLHRIGAAPAAQEQPQ